MPTHLDPPESHPGDPSGKRDYTTGDCRHVPSPEYAPSTMAGASVQCRDGASSFSQHCQGTRVTACNESSAMAWTVAAQYPASPGACRLVETREYRRSGAHGDCRRQPIALTPARFCYPMSEFDIMLSTGLTDNNLFFFTTSEK
jgi:hypothetical protein